MNCLLMYVPYTHPNYLDQLGQQMSSSTGVYCVTFYSCHKMVHPPPLGLMQTFGLANGAGRLLAGLARDAAMLLKHSLASLIIWARQQAATREKTDKRG